MRNEARVSVVIVYLFGYIKAVPHVLLMRRGANVSYMQNAWSVVAGCRNGDISLERQALVEVCGETSLLPTEVSKPEHVGTFDDVDEENGKTWERSLLAVTVIVQAQSHDGLGVRLDWEHREAVWVPIKTILDWLAGREPEDLVARAILFEEKATPDFRINFGRMQKILESLVA